MAPCPALVAKGGRAMAVTPTFPRVQAMVVCDDIQEREEEQGVHDLSGVRGVIQAEEFPHVQPLLCVYAQVTGHPGVVSCRVEITQAGTDELVHITPEYGVRLDGPLVM